MSETDNIARMASRVSDDLFEVFGWQRIPPVNINWPCAMQEAHGKETHPSDVVFSYEDPYRGQTIFVNTDLKSYARGTITKGNIRGACSSLAKSVECAAVSGAWQEKYVSIEGNWRCDGLLFVYNHDGGYDKDFRKIVADADASAFTMPKGRRMAVLGPADVGYLVNVANDIVGLRGKAKLPAEKAGTQFFYPDLVRPRRRPQARSAATIEMLTGPWITIRVDPEYNGGNARFIVYYRERGETVDEFTYLIDSFFRFQMLSVDPRATIEVRLADPDAGKAVTAFSAAKDKVSTSLYGLPEASLERVTCTTISTFVAKFDETVIGMEAR